MSSFRLLSLIAQFLLGTITLYLIIKIGNVNIHQIVQRFTPKSLPFLLLGIGCFFLSMTLIGQRYRFLAKEEIPFKYFLGISLFTNALITFIPWRVGEIGYPWLMNKDQGVTIKNSIFVLFIARTFDFIMILSLFLFSSRETSFTIDPAWLNLYGKILYGGLILTSLLALVMKEKIFKFVRKYQLEWKQLINLNGLLTVFGLSMMIYTVSIMQSKFIFQAAGLTISLTNISWIFSITAFASLIPIHPPGGWGTIDSIQVFLMIQLGYPFSEALATILAVHSIYSLLIILGGFLGWLLRTNSHQIVNTGPNAQ